MKKIFVTTLMSIFLISMAISAEAAKISSEVNNKIAVVIVGGADYKTKDFTNITKNLFKVEDKTKPQVITGKDVQNKYQKYWFNKGLLDEGEPTKEDFINFVDYSGYKKVIFLVIKDSVLEQHSRTKGKDRSRVSLTVNAFIVSSSNIEASTTSTNEEDSKTSELRAKRGAFKLCVEEISEEFNPLIN